MSVEIIGNETTSPSGASQITVKKDDRYFVVSSVVAYSGFETLVFPANVEGEILSFGEVAGGRGMSREEAIADLDESDFSTDDLYEYGEQGL